jgi:hypothetical protein
LSTIGKNYPEIFTLKWLEDSAGHKAPKIQVFLQATIDKIESKKCSQVLKIIEDWLKNYQNLNQADNNDEKVIKEAQDHIMIEKTLKSPFDNPVFCKFLMGLMDKYLLSQKIVEETSFYQGNKLVS